MISLHLPHDQLKDNLNKFINRVFRFKNKSYSNPNISTKKAYFCIVEALIKFVLVNKV